MVATDGDRALFGECKWTDGAIGISTLNELKGKAADFSYKEKYWYLFSKNGFSDELREIAVDDPVKLIDLSHIILCD